MPEITLCGPPDGFVISALPVGRGILALAPLPVAGGHIEEDLAHLRDWSPALVITAMTREELIVNNARTLGNMIEDTGTRWVQLPVTDGATPNPRDDLLWKKTSDSALRALRGGGRVLVHCHGGCGRSGMITMRLMVLAGEAPDKALHRLRRLRPCAIETEMQMRWARMGR